MKTCALMAAVGLALAAGGAAQAAPPKVGPGFKFDATSKYGLVVVLVLPQTSAPEYRLSMNKFDPATRAGTMARPRAGRSFRRSRGARTT